MLRSGIACLLLLTFTLMRALGQTPTPTSGSTLFDTVRPDMIVTIKKHPTGAELVEILFVEESYPQDLIRSQIADLGRRLGVAARGLKLEANPIAAGGQSLTSLKCSFAINGLLDHNAGKVALQPLVQAFAGSNDGHTIKGISVLLDGEIADSRTVRSFKSDAVEVQGIRTDQPMGIEYRILIKSSEPEKIFIPSWSGEQEPIKSPPVPKPSSDWVMYLLVAVAAIAVGALVYSFLLRLPKDRPTSGSK